MANDTSANSKFCYPVSSSCQPKKTSFIIDGIMKDIVSIKGEIDHLTVFSTGQIQSTVFSPVVATIFYNRY